MEAVIIYNPISGRERGSKIAILVANKLSEDFDKMQIIKTKDSSHATKLAKYYTDKGVHSIFAIGGDGTIGDVIKGIELSEKKDKPVLGAIPGGTLNGISRMLGFSRITTRAINSIDLDCTQWIDYGTCNSEPFMMIYSIGDIPESINSTPSDLKTNFSLLAYFHNIAKNATENNHHQLRLNIDGEVFSGNFNHVGIITSNALNHFTPPTLQFDKNDGKLHVFMIGKSNFLDKMIMVPDLLLGNIVDSKNLIYRVAENISISTKEKLVSTDLDGDRFQPVPSEIEIKPKGIQMYVCK